MIKNISMPQIIALWKNLDPKKKVLSSCLGILLISGGFQVFGKSSEKPTNIKSDFESYDELLPEGQSLVPIEVNNVEALAGVLGHQGVVDIFAINPATNRQIRIARYVKVVRSPENYQQLSVLIEDDSTDAIMQYPGPFTLVVQKQKSNAQRMKKSRRKEKINVSYEN